jgi:tetratricopeptide (TPR) repeat protein
LEELQFALEELGVREAQAQSRAAAELLQLAAAQDGSGEDDGTIGFDAFMALQRKVGLLQAISAVDHKQALLLAEEPHPTEEQQWAGSSGLMPSAAYASSSFDSELDSIIFTDASGQPFSPRSLGGGRGAFPAAAAACRAGGGATSLRGGLRWRQQQGWLGSGRWGGFAARGGVVAHAFIDTSNAYSSSSSSSSGSSIDSLESESPAAAGSSSGGAMAAKRVDSSARNSVVALHGSNHATLNGSSSGTTNGSSNGSSANGSSSSNGMQAAAEEQLAEPALRGKPQRAAASASTEQQPEVVDLRAAAGQAAARWRPPPAMQGIVRLVSQPGPTTADATWQLVPVSSNRVGLLNAAGQPLPALAADAAGQQLQALPMPAQGPCVVGGDYDRDCDFIVDAPTVSGRHVRLEVVRQRDTKGGHSSLVLTDLGSTNGTWVNRGRIEAQRQISLRPGDVVSLAEPDISFQVVVAAPLPPATTVAASNGAAASAAAVADAPAAESAAADAQQAAATLPAVVAALRLAGAMEAAAAEQGLFPPGGAVYADLPDRVRQLMAAGSHDQAYVLLLAGVMQQPWAAGLWAQLANAERHRARLGCRPGSFGAARAFYAAAADAFAALTPATAGGALRCAAERAEGLSRVYSSWAQMELSLGHVAAARTLFRAGIAAAREHPAGAAAAGGPRQLVRWAGLEWKAGEAAAAQRLCVEALELEPANAHALTLLGNIEAAARQWVPARRLFKRAMEVDPGHVAALQAWGRLEVAAGNPKQARRLFRDALRLEPSNTHVLQALAVAEARLGDVEQARSLFRRCTEADPSCT